MDTLSHQIAHTHARGLNSSTGARTLGSNASGGFGPNQEKG